MLKEKISEDFMVAFKAKDMNKKNFLGVIKGEIQNAELRGISPTDENVLNILRKMEKSLMQTNTPESLAELEYVKPYLPAMMGKERIKEIILNYQSNGLTNVGQMMGEFNKTFKGLADNKLVSEVIKEVLQ